MSNSITIIISNLNTGGTERVCVSICNELAKRGYDVNLWVVDLKRTYLLEKLSSNINVVSMDAKTIKSTVFEISKLIKIEQPHLLFAFNHKIAAILIFIRVLTKMRFKIFMRCSSTLSLKYKSKISLLHKYVINYFYSRTIKYVDIVIAQSKGMHLDLIVNYKIKPEKIITINNPSVMIATNNNEDLAMIPLEKNHEILFVGRLEPVKGLEYLFESFRIVIESDPYLKLRIIGKGSQLEYLKNLAKCLSIDKNIIFDGLKNEVINDYKKAKATVLTSVYEGFPNVLVESISVGTPVIAFDCQSGPAEIIIDGVNGYLVPYKNIDVFAQAILKTIRNSQFNPIDIIASAERFKIDNIIDRYINVISHY